MENKKIVNKKDLVKQLLRQEINIEDEDDLIEMLIDRPITVDIDKQEDKSLTTGERLADKLSEIAGSWCFIIGFSIFIIIYSAFNKPRMFIRGMINNQIHNHIHSSFMGFFHQPIKIL